MQTPPLRRGLSLLPCGRGDARQKVYNRKLVTFFVLVAMQSMVVHPGLNTSAARLYFV